jgi:hypothetical protein
VKANPLELTLTAPQRVRVGDNFVVRASAENLSANRLRDLSLLLQLDESGLLLRGQETRHRGMLPGQSTVSVEWRLKAIESGGYLLMASASARDSSDGIALSAESSAALLAVVD